MTPIDLLLAKQHQTHLLHHPTCSYCVTEKQLGGKPRVNVYDASILQVIKGESR